jgi:hypothetical protein
VEELAVKGAEMAAVVLEAVAKAVMEVVDGLVV